MFSHITVCVLLVCVLSGCGGRRGVSRQDRDTRTRARTLVLCWYQSPLASALQDMGRRYYRETGILVHVAQLPRRLFDRQVVLHFNKRVTDFDIVVGKGHWLPRFAEQGRYLDLSTMLKRDANIAAVHQKIREAICEYPARSGNFFAAPCFADAQALIYRKDWFEDPAEQASFSNRFGRALAPPATWMELLDVGGYFNRPGDERHGFMMPTERSAGSLAYSFQQILRANGGRCMDAATARVVGHLNGPEAIHAIDLTRRLIKMGPAGAGEASLDDVVTSILKGRTAVVMCPASVFRGISLELEDRVGFAPVPGREAVGGSVSLVDGYSLSVSAGIPDHRKAMAMAFITWFLSREVQADWQERTGFSFDSQVLASAAYREAVPFGDAYARALEHAEPYWNVRVNDELMPDMLKYIGDAVDGFMDPQTALDTLADRCEDKLRSAQLLTTY